MKTATEVAIVNRAYESLLSSQMKMAENRLKERLQKQLIYGADFGLSEKLDFTGLDELYNPPKTEPKPIPALTQLLEDAINESYD